MFCIKDCLLRDAQNGFRKKGSTERAVQSFLESTKDSIDKGEN
jgi:hypothetical protein